MKQSAYLGFSYDNCSTTRKIKSKTLKGMFAEAKRIVDKYNKVGCLKITLHYGVYLAPVPRYAGDCKFMEFTLYDRKEEERIRH